MHPKYGAQIACVKIHEIINSLCCTNGSRYIPEEALSATFMKKHLGEKEVARARSSARGGGEGVVETGRAVDEDEAEMTGRSRDEGVFDSADSGMISRGRSTSTCWVGEATAVICGRSSGALDSDSR